LLTHASKVADLCFLYYLDYPLKTIRQIRFIQIICQICLAITAMIAATFIGAILKIYHLSTTIGMILGDLFIGLGAISAILLITIKYLRCPVCRNVFVGKEDPQWFAVKCRHCGRRSGDTH
jgi:hypothetical protein